MKNDLGYSNFLKNSGLTEEDTQWMMKNLSDPVNNTIVDNTFKLGTSTIHGIGLFATKQINRGDSFPVCDEDVYS